MNHKSIQKAVTQKAKEIKLAAKNAGLSLKQYLGYRCSVAFPSPYCKDDPTEVDFHLQYDQLLFWDPQHFFGLEALLCPDCGSTSSCNSWSADVRPVKCVGAGTTWIYSRRHECSKCRRGFAASDPESLQKLPRYVRLQFPASLRPKSAVSATTEDLITALSGSGTGYETIASTFNEVQQLHHVRELVCRLSLAVERRSTSPLNLDILHLKPTANKEGLFSGEYVRNHHVEATEPLCKEYERDMARVTFKVMSVDSVYKNAPKVRVAGVMPFKNTLFAMNQIKEIGAFYNLSGDGLGALEKALTLLYLRHELQGEDGPVLLYTDNVKKDAAIAIAAIPSLGKGLPADDCGVKQDLFHLNQRFDDWLPQGHPANELFMRCMNRCCMYENEEDVLTFKASAKPNQTPGPHDVRRHVYAKEELARRYEETYNRITRDAYTTSGQPLRSKELDDQFQRNLELIKAGYVSDPDPSVFPHLHINRQPDPSKPPEYITARGTNKNEGANRRHEQCCLSGANNNIATAKASYTMFVGRNNIAMRIQNGGQPDVGHFNPILLRYANEDCEALGLPLLFPHVKPAPQEPCYELFGCEWQDGIDERLAAARAAVAEKQQQWAAQQQVQQEQAKVAMVLQELEPFCPPNSAAAGMLQGVLSTFQQFPAALHSQLQALKATLQATAYDTAPAGAFQQHPSGTLPALPPVLVMPESASHQQQSAFHQQQSAAHQQQSLQQACSSELPAGVKLEQRVLLLPSDAPQLPPQPAAAASPPDAEPREHSHHHHHQQQQQQQQQHKQARAAASEGMQAGRSSAPKPASQQVTRPVARSSLQRPGAAQHADASLRDLPALSEAAHMLEGLLRHVGRSKASAAAAAAAAAGPTHSSRPGGRRRAYWHNSKPGARKPSLLDYHETDFNTEEMALFWHLYPHFGSKNRTRWLDMSTVWNTYVTGLQQLVPGAYIKPRQPHHLAGFHDRTVRHIELMAALTYMGVAAQSGGNSSGSIDSDLTAAKQAVQQLRQSALSQLQSGAARLLNGGYVPPAAVAAEKLAAASGVPATHIQPSSSIAPPPAVPSQPAHQPAFDQAPTAMPGPAAAAPAPTPPAATLSGGKRSRDDNSCQGPPAKLRAGEGTRGSGHGGRGVAKKCVKCSQALGRYVALADGHAKVCPYRNGGAAAGGGQKGPAAAAAAAAAAGGGGGSGRPGSGRPPSMQFCVPAGQASIAHMFRGAQQQGASAHQQQQQQVGAGAVEELQQPVLSALMQHPQQTEYLQHNQPSIAASRQQLAAATAAALGPMLQHHGQAGWSQLPPGAYTGQQAPPGWAGAQGPGGSMRQQ